MKKSHIAALLTSSVYLTTKIRAPRSINIDLLTIGMKVIEKEKGKGNYIYIFPKINLEEDCRKKFIKGIYHTDLVIRKKNDFVNIKFNKKMYSEHPFIIVNEDVFGIIPTDPGKRRAYLDTNWDVLKNANGIDYKIDSCSLTIMDMEPGTYRFVCKLHANMGGTITIID